MRSERGREFLELRCAARTAAAIACPVRRAGSLFSRDARLCIGLDELAAGVPRCERRRGARGSRSNIPRRSSSMPTCNGWPTNSCCSAQALDARARHADRPVWRLCGGRQSVGFRDLGGSSQLLSRRRNRRAPRSFGAQRARGGEFLRRIQSVMQAQHLQGFVQLIRDNMRYYGALRLDHVMSLCRLWWVPAGCAATAGRLCSLSAAAAVDRAEPGKCAQFLLGRRRRSWASCPTRCARRCRNSACITTRCCCSRRSPADFAARRNLCSEALAAATTHDMPTLRSYWEARDIELRRRLNLFPSAEIESDVVRERDHDREMLLAALREQGINPAQPARRWSPTREELGHALHLYLARSSTALVALQIEDLLGMVDPVNVPGTMASIRTGSARSPRISRTWRRAAILPRTRRDQPRPRLRSPANDSLVMSRTSRCCGGPNSRAQTLKPRVSWCKLIARLAFMPWAGRVFRRIPRFSGEASN